MKMLTDDIIRFFQKQGFVIVSTVQGDGYPHSSCKGIVRIEPDGYVYLLDLYRSKTLENLQGNSRINITAVDEHRYRGYCLKGKAILSAKQRIRSQVMKEWDKKIAARLAKRILKEVRAEEGHPDYPEVALPKPEYMIVMRVEEVVDLAAHSYR